MTTLIYVLLVLGMFSLTYKKNEGRTITISVGVITNTIILILLFLGKITITT